MSFAVFFFSVLGLTAIVLPIMVWVVFALALPDDSYGGGLLGMFSGAIVIVGAMIVSEFWYEAHNR